MSLLSFYIANFWCIMLLEHFKIYNRLLVPESLFYHQYCETQDISTTNPPNLEALLLVKFHNL